MLSKGFIYRIAGNFRGGANFRYFRDYPVSHEIFHPRNFSPTNFQSVIAYIYIYRASGVTKFKTTKINSEDPRQLFTKICTPENYPLYGSPLVAPCEVRLPLLTTISILAIYQPFLSSTADTSFVDY